MEALNKNKFLNEEELASLRRTASDMSRDSILIRFAIETGARASEILSLTQKEFNEYDKTVFIKTLKRNKNREIPLSNKMFENIKSLFSKQTEFIFNISYSRLVKIWNYYRPSKKSFHSIRHTFAIELYKKHRDIKLVQICLGHRSISTTQIYTEYVFTTEEVRRALRCD